MAGIENKTVTVKPGDTLSQIALENLVPLDSVRNANPSLTCSNETTNADGYCADSAGKKRNSGGDLIYPGDTVVVPSNMSHKIDTTKLLQIIKDFQHTMPCK